MPEDVDVDVGRERVFVMLETDRSFFDFELRMGEMLQMQDVLQ